MSVYFIANIKIHDAQEYGKYLDGCDEVFAKYKGEYLAVEERPVVLEGEWNYTKIVLIRFPSDAELRQWYESDEYQEILKYRLNGARCDTVIANGVP